MTTTVADVTSYDPQCMHAQKKTRDLTYRKTTDLIDHHHIESPYMMRESMIFKNTICM